MKLNLWLTVGVFLADGGTFFGIMRNEKGPASLPGLEHLRQARWRYAASSSTTASSSVSDFGPRRGPLASAASISLIASVSVIRCTAETSRDSRSSAAS